MEFSLFKIYGASIGGSLCSSFKNDELLDEYASLYKLAIKSFNQTSLLNNICEPIFSFWKINVGAKS